MFEIPQKFDFLRPIWQKLHTKILLIFGAKIQKNLARFARKFIKWDLLSKINFFIDVKILIYLWQFFAWKCKNVTLVDPYLRHFCAAALLSSFSFTFCVAPQGVNSGPSITLAV